MSYLMDSPVSLSDGTSFDSLEVPQRNYIEVRLLDEYENVVDDIDVRVRFSDTQDDYQEGFCDGETELFRVDAARDGPWAVELPYVDASIWTHAFDGGGDQRATSVVQASENSRADATRCLARIAYERTIHPLRIVQAQANQMLFNRLPDRNIIPADETLVIPGRQTARYVLAVNRLYQFTVLGLYGELAIEVMVDDAPVGDRDYRITGEGFQHESSLTDYGMLRCDVPLRLDNATVEIDGVGRFELGLGALQPAQTKEGVIERLLNCGLIARAPTSELEYSDMLREFQIYQNIDETGDLDQSTIRECADTYECATAGDFLPFPIVFETHN